LFDDYKNNYIQGWKLRFAFRVDSSPEIGLGHLMRCLTLANELQRFGYESYFICRDFPQNHSHLLLESDFKVILLDCNRKPNQIDWLGVSSNEDVSACVPILKDIPVDWLVVDHYSIDNIWSSQIRKEFPDLKIMAIDDLANRSHDCDFLLDQTYNRKRSDYNDLIPQHATFCGGTDYALIRREFLKARENSKDKIHEDNDSLHILLALGGGDVSSQISIVGQALLELSKTNSFSLTAIIGQTDDSYLKSIRSCNLDLELLKFSNNIAEEMAKADIAIGAGGGTSWERCCVGVPTIVLTLAKNQIEIAKILHSENAGISVKTDFQDILSALKKMINDKILLKQMRSNALKLCDGKGLDRVISALISDSFSLRQINLSDAKFIYDARYSNGASKYYRNQETPNFSDHKNWLENAMKDKNRKLINFSLDGVDVAHVRLDLKNSNHGEIGICLSQKMRGKGLGVAVLNAANNYFLAKGITTIEAEINKQNMASQKIFCQAGYEYLSTDNEGFMRYLWAADNLKSSSIKAKTE